MEEEVKEVNLVIGKTLLALMRKLLMVVVISAHIQLNAKCQEELMAFREAMG